MITDMLTDTIYNMHIDICAFFLSLSIYKIFHIPSYCTVWKLNYLTICAHLVKTATHIFSLRSFEHLCTCCVFPYWYKPLRLHVMQFCTLLIEQLFSLDTTPESKLIQKALCQILNAQSSPGFSFQRGYTCLNQAEERVILFHLLPTSKTVMSQLSHVVVNWHFSSSS